MLTPIKSELTYIPKLSTLLKTRKFLGGDNFYARRKMKVLTNKFFIFGNLLLLLIAIPLTLFFVKKQQEVRSKAAASARLYFSPATTNTSTQCQSFTVDVMLDPGTNAVSIVHFYITYDATKLDITQIKESSTFSFVDTQATISNGQADMAVDAIGGANSTNTTKAVTTISKVATITFVPKAAGTATIAFDAQKSLVLQPSANELSVLSTTTPGSVVIGSDACPAGAGAAGNTTPTPGTGGASPTPTGGTLLPTPTTSALNTSPTPTGAANQAPVCSALTVSPSATGPAPFSVLFTGQGNDPDTTGLITKATFNFGDGQTQDITTGLNQKTVTTQASHTYQNGGVFPASLTFTDNQNAVSQNCTQTITASGSAATTPTVIPTTIPTVAPTLVEKPTAAPTIAPTGNIGRTIGILSTVIVALVGGFLLLAL